MSLTTLLAAQSVMLSPSRKRWLDQEPGGVGEDSRPTRSQLWRWCLRGDAVAQCYIRDVLQLKVNAQENGQDSDTIWWLGTVPCRSVTFVGMLVGAKAYEKRTVYTMDDGTGVIACVHIHPHDKQKPRHPPARDAVTHTRSSAGARPAKLAMVHASECPSPRFEVGDILRVTGRVEAWHDIRQIVINDFHLCRPNEEPQHWIATAKLHKEYYTQPFTIPPLPPPPLPQTPPKPTRDATLLTPKTATTPSTTASSSSRTSNSTDNARSRLRHPSRLRSKELIASTFKIYLKTYMDALSDPARHVPCDEHAVESPVKRPRHSLDDATATPRPKERESPFVQGADSTPRALHWNAAHPLPIPARARGFTLSFLRRVPELAHLARCVVEQERKRRVREERKKQDVAAAATSGSKRSASQSAHEEPSGRKAKRLYMWTLRELHREGSIILHEDDASLWEFPPARASAGLWRPARGMRDGVAGASADACEMEDVSDAPAYEESYVPLTPALLTEPILDAIKALMSRRPKPASRTKPVSRGQPPQPPSAPNSYRGPDDKAVGPTAAELRAYLSRVDARWEHVGEYTVMDALEVLRREERVYRAGNGKWELAI